LLAAEPVDKVVRTECPTPTVTIYAKKYFIVDGLQGFTPWKDLEKNTPFSRIFKGGYLLSTSVA
jgi:hypothetical protein